MGVDNKIIASCRRWVEEVIVGLNFCPFAKPVVESGGLVYRVVNETSFEACLLALSDEFQRLQADSSIETSLLILPQGFDEFDDYLELLAVADALIEDQSYEGVFQLASFHPDYCFEGQSAKDASNYTNRSPYPMLHLLRESSIEQALATVASPEKIPARNIEVARAKGADEMERLLEACRVK